MRALLRHFWTDLVNDEKAARRVLATVMLSTATGLGTCVPFVTSSAAKVACALAAAIIGGLSHLAVVDKS